MNSKKHIEKLESAKVSPFGGDLEGALDGAVIRKAVKEDCKRMLELVKELAAYERAPDEVTVTLEHFTESGFGKKPVWWAFVATSKIEEEETILGFAMYYIRFSTWKGQRMYLEDFIVTEQARGKGIGKLLFDKLVEEAKEKKFCGISWQVLHWNEAAINFYKKYYNATIEEGWLNCSYPIPLKGIKKKSLK
jgi:ribosomal protein S18 acetylase RimI-like enzyme